ncbi:aminotransferase class V-fold PLP-dependent enzyme [Cyanobium sp. FGCU-6]|nr:aminotransferase class V-fold PLP-dependent enzyme [Cyanobium sp. FGCU6]
MATSFPATQGVLGAEPLAPFPDPHRHDPELERFLHDASSQLCRWLGSASATSPLPGLSVLPAVEPEPTGLTPDRLLADLQLVMEGAYNPGHPGAIAHLDPPPLAASVAADLICAGLNNNLLAEELSPSLSRLERSLCGWLAERLGLPAGAGGVAASGGSLSNLMALVVARHHRGLLERRDAVVVASEEAHVSLAKALVVMGLPPSALVAVPTDAGGRLDAAALDLVLSDLERAGRPVIAVVATAGTTVRGAVDPLPEVATLCRRHGHWLHVDGAIGAVFALAPAHAGRVEGLGLADSLTVNPQKLLGITKTSSLLLLARPALLLDTFHTGLPYMELSWGGGHGGETGLQGTRPAEILKLWLGLRQLGETGIAALIQGAIERRRHLERLLCPLADLELVQGSLHLLAFRPAGLSPEVSERWSQDTRQALLARQLMLSRPLYRGHHHLKAVLGNPHTAQAELAAVAEVVGRSLPSP